MKKLFPVLLLAALFLLPTTAFGKAETRGVGSPALSDWEAASRVERKREIRWSNDWNNRRTPADWELRDFRSRSDMPYKDRVTGNFTGTTDEIIQWAAHKHGIDEDTFKAVARQESYWRMTENGDGGDSFGLMQMRRPYHCCLPYMKDSTAFNVDYYGAIIRSYYDGRQTWLNTVGGNGWGYGSGDLWGAVGAWFSGRWHDWRAEEYIRNVQRIQWSREWESSTFINAG